MRHDPRFDGSDPRRNTPPYGSGRPDLPPQFGDRPSRMRLFWRRQKRLVRPAIVTLGVLGILAVGGRFFYDAASEKRFAPLRAKLVQMQPLQIRHVIINGRGLTTETEINEALGTGIGHPIFGFSVEAARTRIDALPFVDHATVERHMPDTVVINITERTPIAVWQDHGHFSLINRAGEEVPDQGLTGKNAEAFLRLPLVVGDGANSAAAFMIDALSAQPVVKSQVTALIRVGSRRWDMTLRDGTTILLPEGAEAAALARLAQYEGSMRLLERPVPSIDLRLPDRMVIHQAPPPPPSPPTPDAQKQP
ncbi:cell division protein FtsQ/DivIB [Gluconobacter wancherniae]|uniref:cell division protein FtsQ/DivIB n=2 Tax=Gluconobacter wancherniae TaxID=1307955 RepID=UPI0011BF2E52|nr:cell division protein FtsQ/DivIB [Gluconobacter wancherniae]MBF0853730.1 FtsQ-type POTRA domain-containing protein [Gluconobacter wancherniae]MBS1094205.1 FtsQ-type POTRA domain-containing protein [Gluconobacter wancherniae]GBD55521.1 cell division protein FtsQ [Gluconobacter wancherniae NBRC 103581]